MRPTTANTITVHSPPVALRKLRLITKSIHELDEAIEVSPLHDAIARYLESLP